MFSGMGQGDQRSKSRVNYSDRPDDRCSSMSPLTDAEVRRGKAQTPTAVDNGLFGNIGSKDAEVSSTKKAKQQEYSRLLAAQREQDELRKQQRHEEDKGVSHTRSRSVNRAAPSSCSVDPDSPYIGKPSSMDSNAKKQQQLEYFRVLKEQEESNKALKDAHSRRSSAADLYDEGLLKGVGARERPQSAGRRRMMQQGSAGSGNNIFSNDNISTKHSQQKRDIQDEYRRQLNSDLDKKGQQYPSSYNESPAYRGAGGGGGRGEIDDYELEDLVRNQRQASGGGAGGGGGYPVSEDRRGAGPSSNVQPQMQRNGSYNYNDGPASGQQPRRISSSKSESTGLMIGGMTGDEPKARRRGPPTQAQPTQNGTRYNADGAPARINSFGGGPNSFRLG